MKKTVKMVKDYMGHAVGSIIILDELTFAEWKAAGVCEEFDAEAAGLAKKQADDAAAAQQKAIDDAVAKALSSNKDSDKDNPYQKGVKAQVRDLSDDDPCHGYLGEHNKALKDLSPSEIHYAAGRQMKDIVSASSGGRTSELLRKSMERTDNARRKATETGLLVNDDEFGGYMMFPAASLMILEANVDASIIRQRARRVTMGTQLLKLPFLRDDTRTAGLLYNGINVLFESELSSGTYSRPKLGHLEMRLKKMMAFGAVSGEWNKWAPVTMGSWYIPLFGQALGYREDIEFLTGVGGGQPIGLLNAACKIEIAKESNQAADTFVLENSTKMKSRVKAMVAGSGSSLVWIMNQEMWRVLPYLNVEVGTGGAPVFVANVAGDIAQSLWGVPIVFTEKVPTLGDAGDVVLADLGNYLIADDQSGPEIASSIHLQFNADQEVFRVIKYIDGQNIDTTATAPYKAGSTTPPTLSPVVTLAERA